MTITEVRAETATIDPHSAARRPLAAYGRSSAFPAAALATPMFEGKDLAGLIAAVAITLGPLAANSLGWGA